MEPKPILLKILGWLTMILFVVATITVLTTHVEGDVATECVSLQHVARPPVLVVGILDVAKVIGIEQPLVCASHRSLEFFLLFRVGLWFLLRRCSADPNRAPCPKPFRH